jgi:hypothetical protein
VSPTTGTNTVRDSNHRRVYRCCSQVDSSRLLLAVSLGSVPVVHVLSCKRFSKAERDCRYWVQIGYDSEQQVYLTEEAELIYIHGVLGE